MWVHAGAVWRHVGFLFNRPHPALLCSQEPSTTNKRLDNEQQAQVSSVQLLLVGQPYGQQPPQVTACWWVCW
jgi:hypothetical protein